SQRRCQETIARAGRALLERATAAVADCRRGASRDSACLAQPSVSRAIDGAARKALRPVARRCHDADVAAIAPAGDCRGARTVGALVACLGATHRAQAAALSSVVDGGSGRLRGAAPACALQVSRQSRRLARVRQRLVQKCKRDPERYALPAGTACAAAPTVASQLAALGTRAASRIAARCDGALSETSFGAPCDVVADGPALARCA